MRTTVVFDDDVAAAIDRVRRERSIGLSEAVNELVRSGLRTKRRSSEFRQRSRPMGKRIAVTDVADAIDLLEGPAAR